MWTAFLVNFDKVDKAAFILSRGRFFPFYTGKSICYKKGTLRARSFRQSCQNCILLFQSDILGEQFFLKEKKFFLSSFPTFCWNFSKFLIHFGHLGQRLRNCWWNCTPLVRTKVLVGKGVCRSFHVYKTISSWSEKFWDHVKKSFPYGWQFGILIF